MFADRIYIAIDLKSFYASVECVERGLDALTTNLVVADVTRTDKTICLAVSPSLKSYGIPGRARLFEVIAAVDNINAERRLRAPGRSFVAKSVDAVSLKTHQELELDYIIATPQMAHYIDISTKIYGIYLNYVSPDDIHVYSIDEVFIDATEYLAANKLSAREFATKMIHDIFSQTGITATAGIGTNLYLCKVAMDIVAKHIPADEYGVRIASLDVAEYRRRLWSHTPLTDFWRVGRGYSAKLAEYGIYTMGDIARCSLDNEELLYNLFGVNAELLIDHAWGIESCLMEDIKSYRPISSSISSGQVLPHAYTWEKGRLIIREMTDQLALDLVDKGIVTDRIGIMVAYDGAVAEEYSGMKVRDFYGRRVPAPVHGSKAIGRFTSSSRLLTEAALEIFDSIVDSKLMVRRVSVFAGSVREEREEDNETGPIQLDIFTDYAALDASMRSQNAELRKERTIQQTMLEIKKKFGKNALLKGMNLADGATAVDRNNQIGGHKA